MCEGIVLGRIGSNASIARPYLFQNSYKREGDSENKELVEDLKSSIIIFSFIVIILIPSLVIGQNIPPLTDYNEEDIFFQEHWDLFESINGFSNVPTLISYDGEPMYIEITNPTVIHNISLESSPSYYVDSDNNFHVKGVAVHLNYTRIVNNVSYKESSFPISQDDLTDGVHYLTVWQDEFSNIHIFWMNAFEGEDNESRYAILYSNIDENGEILVENRLIYWDRGEVPEPPEPGDGDSWIFFLLIIFQANILSAIALILYEWKKRPSEKHDSGIIAEDKFSGMGKTSYHLAIFFYLFNPLTITITMAYLSTGAGLIILLLIPIYPFLVAIPFVMGLLARKTVNGKKALFISTILLAIAIIVAVYLILNPPYIP